MPTVPSAPLSGEVSASSDAPVFFYFNLLPESLVASNLEPAAYAAYLATGEAGYSRGQALFFEVRPELLPEVFPIQEARARCHPGPTGIPKHSVYLGIYRVLEHLPLEALGTLHLVTDDGRALGLSPGEYPGAPETAFHYYQELVPVKPRILSRLGPDAFARLLCSGERTFSVPRVAFAELALPKEWTQDRGDLPYQEWDHLWDCRIRMKEDPEKKLKMITRYFPGELLYRTVSPGFFVGDANGLVFYPMPSRDDLQNLHRDWWRSAETLHGY